MKTFVKFLGFASLLLALPLISVPASAAEYRQPGQAVDTLNGVRTPAPQGHFAKAPEAEKIVVAGRGARVGAAIVGGIVAGALIAGAARAHDDRRYYYTRRRYEDRCERWLWKCDRGSDWACRNFYRYCD
jgi:hypothetical protein